MNFCAIGRVFTGNVTRLCDGIDDWAELDTSNCVNVEFNSLDREVMY